MRICVMSMIHIETLVQDKSMEMFDELKTILELLVIFTTLSQSPLLLATAVAAVAIYLLMKDQNNDNDSSY